MSNLVSAAKPGLSGVAHFAPTGTTLPTDATTALSSTYVGLGYVSEDGVTNSVERSVESIKDMGGNEVLTVQTEFSDTFKFTLISSKSVDVKKAVYGDSKVTGSLANGITTTVSADELPYKTWVFDLVLSDGDVQRMVVPTAKVNEIGEVAYKNSEAIGYEITLKALPISGTNTYHYEYLKTPSAESE